MEEYGGEHIRGTPAARPEPLPKIRLRLTSRGGLAEPVAAVSSSSLTASWSKSERIAWLRQGRGGLTFWRRPAHQPSSSTLATAGRSKPFHTVPTYAAKGQLAPPEAKLQRKDFRRADGAQMTPDCRCEGTRPRRVRRAPFRAASVTSQSRKRFRLARSTLLTLRHQLPRFRASRVSLRFLS